MMSRFLWLPVVAGYAAGVVCAAESERSSASFRFLKFSDVPALCAQGSSDKYVPLDVFQGHLGRPVRLPTKRPIALWERDAQDAPVKRGEALAPPVAVVPPLEAPRQLVILFRTANRVEARVIPDNATRFPFGRVLAINLTDADYVTELGGAPTRVPARGAALCAAPARLAGPDNATVTITEAGKREDPVYSSVWIFGPRLRTLVFLYKNEAGGLLVRMVQDVDHPSLAEAPEEAPKKAGKAGR